MRLEAFSSPRVADLRSRQARSIGEIARRAGLRVLTVSLRSGELTDAEFSAKCSHSADLAAVAHLLSPRLSSVSIAAGYDAFHLEPWGSHPLIDPNYSSSALSIRLEQFGLTRAERVASVARWDEILPFLLVCAEGPVEPGLSNCGRCEKCLRTMIELLLAGRLRRPSPFPEDDVDPARLEKIRLAPKALPFWNGFPAALRQRGRDDLALAVESLLAEARHLSDWFQDRGFKGRVRSLDRRFFRGRLLAARRRISGRRGRP